MKRLIICSVTAAVAAVPAVFGLAGNASFAHSVPVRVPSQAQLVDDKGGQTRHAEPGDDNGGSSSGQGADDGAGDDNGSHGGDDGSGDDNGGHGGDDGSGHK